MSHKYFTPIDKLVSIKTNQKDFKFSYGLSMPNSNKNEYESSEIKIDINILPNSECSKLMQKVNGKFHYFSGEPGEGVIYYDRGFFFNTRLQYIIEGINTNHIKITANKTYNRFVTHRFMNLHSIGYIVTDILNLKLLNNGYCPLHCSGFSKDGEAYLIFAPPNTGKTLSSMQLCMDGNELDFVAEDLAVSNGKTVFAAPWTSTFRYYTAIDNTLKNRFLSWLTEKVSVVELMGLGGVDPITKYVNEENIAMQTKIKGIYILERGEKSIKEISEEESFWRILTLDRYEFNHMRAPAVVANEYFNYSGAIDDSLEAEKKILSELIDNAEFIRIVKSDNAMDYAPMIKSNI